MGFFQKGKATNLLTVMVSHPGLAPKFTPREAEKLIAQGADVNALMPEGKSPLAHIAIWGNTDVAQVLLNHGADPNGSAKREAFPLGIAAQNGHDEMVRLLLAKGADVNAQDQWGQTALHRAVGPDVARRSNVIETLVDHGADPRITNHDGETPLADYARMVRNLVGMRPVAGTTETQADCDRRDRELTDDLRRLTALLGAA